MSDPNQVLKDIQAAQLDMQQYANNCAKSGIEVLIKACEDGATIEFDDAVQLARLIHLHTEPNIGAGALYNWSGLEDVIYEMEIAQEKFEESCKVADDKRDFAWEADAASINRENARVAA